jgi:hypothetical protein
MGKKEVRWPADRRRREVYDRVNQSTFIGMLYKSCPLQKIPNGYCFKNVNIIDKGKWFEGRQGTRVVYDLNLDTETPGVFQTINGSCYHKRMDKIILANTGIGSAVVDVNDWYSYNQIYTIS